MDIDHLDDPSDSLGAGFAEREHLNDPARLFTSRGRATMSYSSSAIANFFLDKATIEGDELDHLKVQKLVYLAHGWHLALHGEPLLDEPVEAWKYGPVIPSLYHRLKPYGNQPVTENVVEYGDFEVHVPSISPKDDATRKLLNRVWDVYKDYSGVQLSNMTHEPGTPWANAWKRRLGRQSIRLKNRHLEEHFRHLARQNRKERQAQ